MKVLIADDSRLIQERLATLLSDIEGVEIVGQAYDVAESMSAIHDLRPNVVILDIRFPKDSGFDVLQSITKNEHSPTVIVLTNYPYPQYRSRASKLGAEHFFDKATEFEKVIDVLRALSLDHESE